VSDRRNDRLDVLHLIEAPMWTGAMDQTLELVLGLLRRGHRVTLACTPGSILSRRASEAGVDVVEVELRSELNPVAVASLSSVVRRRGVEIIHAHRAHAHSIGLLTSRVTRRPYVVTRHTALRPKDNFATRLKYRSRFVTRFVAISRAVKDVLVGYGVPGEKIAVIYDGIDTDRYRPGGDGARVLSELDVPADAPLVGKVANFYGKSKGHATFLDAASAVAERVPQVRFLLAGHSTDSDEMRSMAEQRGLADRIVLAGYRADVPDVLAALDVLVNVPIAREGLSVAIMEAMATGVPVVGSDVGGIPELIADGETGLLVPPGDAPALAAAIERLLTDVELAARLASAGARFVRENLTVEHMVEKTERLYREIL